MTIQQAIETLKPALKNRFTYKYAVAAINDLKHGYTVLAREECLHGHFVAGHDGDKTFLPVRVWLEDIIAQGPQETVTNWNMPINSAWE